ncbi:electron transfer flavoprotein subunit beta/FixA family protein [Clostridium estertheticum]|uniref:electron transfer flavoprotein subunit beta/FixA family protein n=1 Tax=Clostridium estertheticum TaxID=238834 RepID=UPI001C7D90ED|nr:electron transfer flavoprotein subunit beta/FixA family protein [Clostridium estertheticum]MBX4264834.1 electron transfer flavoprotein subunit beta/FixA family protein [Clostridium estertheticum]MCB2361269.1 electron transfer flavoprotein subunit beta/FixA family protein [Clostridium estertheticum]WLC88316.1 electron transfer flavoprotein subunit beta/FixA family protein [Clostridium estertheticum]
MHILVCVKQVPDTTEIKMDPKTNTMDRSSAPTIINPFDAHAVEEAVKIKKEFGGKVSIISMGPPKAEEVIKKCIEMGADEGYLLTDRAFAGSDTLSTSYILAMGIKKVIEIERIDLLLCGKQAIDGDTAQVGPGIACRLGMPQLTYVESIENFNLKKNVVVVHRKIDNGYEVVQSKLPCLITVEKDINELSFSPLPNMIKAARYKPITWGINDLGGDLSKLGLNGSPTSVQRIFSPKQRVGGELLKGSEDEVVKTLVDKLKGGIRKWQL